MKKVMQITLLGSIVSSSILFSVHPAFARTLTETVDQTIQSNPDVQIDAKRRLSADQVVAQAQGGYYPKIDLALGIGREHSENITTRPGSTTLWRREAGLTLTQMLYDGYSVKSEVERTEASANSAAHVVAGTSERIGLRTVEVYLDVLRRQEQLALTQENLAAHQRTFEQIRLRSDTGVGRKADMEQAQARLSLSQANLSSAQANLREASINFQRVVGNAPDGLDAAMEVNCELFPATVDEATQLAFANNPLMHAAYANYEASLAQESGAGSAFRPLVNAELGADWNRNLDGVHFKDNDAYAMLRLRYNVYRGGADAARVAETGYQTKEALQIMNRVQRQVEESSRLSWNALETAKDRLPKLKAHADATALTRDAYAQQFNIGQRTLLDLLDAENELYTARSDYLTGLYAERFARYQLMTDMGKLLDTLGVAPREESRITSAAHP